MLGLHVCLNHEWVCDMSKKTRRGYCIPLELELETALSHRLYAGT